MQNSMIIATLLAFVCSANAATLVRERTQQLHKSAAASSGARLWTEEEDPFRRLAAGDGSMSMLASMSTAATSSMSYPEVEEIPDVDAEGSEEGDREVDVAESSAMTVGTAVSALAAAGAMMFL